jgi:hypothetical protein
VRSEGQRCGGLRMVHGQDRIAIAQAERSVQQARSGAYP